MAYARTLHNWSYTKFGLKWLGKYVLTKNN